MKHTFIATLAATALLGAMSCANAGTLNGLSLNGWSNGWTNGWNNGLTVNGLSTSNGLNTGNGLNSSNGLNGSNGLDGSNGLTSSNGLNAANGLSSGKIPSLKDLASKPLAQ